jgi:hypothetical protein
MDKLQQLGQVLPVLGTATGNSQIGDLVQKLLDIATNEIQLRRQESGMTTEAILQQASETWDQALSNAQKLKDMQ